MNRRGFMQNTLASAALLALGRAQLATADATWQAQFHAALADKPWLLGFLGTDANQLDTPDARIEGRLPAELRGTLFRNGPARHEIGGYRYHHWFDGDGMVQAFRFTDDGVSHRGRIIATQKLVEETFAGKPLYPAFGSLPADPRPVTGPDTVNVANISVLPHAGKLLALWEAGSPHEIDPQTLETRGIHAYTPEMRGVAFSAHPRVEPNGTLWNFGYVSGAGLIVLWHIDATGRLVKAGRVPVTPMSMPHDFVVTEKHLVILIPPLHYENVEATDFLSAHVWHPERPTQVLVVDKNDFSQFFFCELPAQWVFHFGNAWEDGAGVIRFDGARAAGPDAMLSQFREIMRGVVLPDTDPGRHALYSIDTRNRTAREEFLLDASISSEFPAIDPRVATTRHRRVIVLTRDTTAPLPHPLLDAVTVLEIDSGVTATYRYPDHQIPEEHLLVPAPDSAPETNGFVIGTFLDWREARTGINIFDVRSIASGPVATATLDYALPLGLHGKFVTG